MKEYLQSLGLFTPEEITEAMALATKQRFKKKEHFIREGGVCRKVAFVNHGIFRTYYVDSKGESTTYCFTMPDKFVTAYSSFVSQQPSPESIEAITDCEVLVLSKATIDDLTTRSTNWLRYFKTVAEEHYIGLEKRVLMLQRESAETRYEDLLANHPDYLQEIPMKYLASYLGMTQRHMSRLRGKIRE